MARLSCLRYTDAAEDMRRAKPPWETMTPFLALTLALGTATTSAAPPSPASAALLRDLSTIVLVAEQQLWHLDHYEIEALVPAALQCICRAAPETRAEALTWLKAETKRLGGPPKAAWLAAGRDLDAIAPLLTVDRTRMVLETAQGFADARCPFWIAPQGAYRDRHRATQRFTFNFDGGGLFTATSLDDELRLGGGGSGRLTVAYGFSPRWSIRFGPELGGAGLLRESLETEDIEVTLFGAVMTSLRRRANLWHWDIEAGPITAGVPWRDVQRYGGRLGTIIGITYPRIARAQPWAGVRAAIDYLPGQRGADAQWIWRSGFRVGFDVYPAD